MGAWHSVDKYSKCESPMKFQARNLTLYHPAVTHLRGLGKQSTAEPCLELLTGGGGVLHRSSTDDPQPPAPNAIRKKFY